MFRFSNIVQTFAAIGAQTMKIIWHCPQKPEHKVRLSLTCIHGGAHNCSPRDNIVVVASIIMKHGTDVTLYESYRMATKIVASLLLRKYDAAAFIFDYAKA